MTFIYPPEEPYVWSANLRCFGSDRNRPYTRELRSMPPYKKEKGTVVVHISLSSIALMKFDSLPFFALAAMLIQQVFAIAIPQVSSSILNAEQDSLIWNENTMGQPGMHVKAAFAADISTKDMTPITLEAALTETFGWDKHVSRFLTRFLDAVDRMHPMLGGGPPFAEFQLEVRQLVANAGYAYRSDHQGRRVLTRMQQSGHYHESADLVAQWIVKLLQGLANSIDKLKASVDGIDFLTKLLNGVGVRLKVLILLIKLQILKHQIGIK